MSKILQDSRIHAKPIIRKRLQMGAADWITKSAPARNFRIFGYGSYMEPHTKLLAASVTCKSTQGMAQRVNDLQSVAKILLATVEPQRRQVSAFGRSFGEIVLGKEIEEALIVKKIASNKTEAKNIATLLLNAKFIRRISRKRDKLRAALTCGSGSFKAGNSFYRYAQRFPDRTIQVEFKIGSIENIKSLPITEKMRMKDLFLTMQVDKQRAQSQTVAINQSSSRETFVFSLHPSMQDARLEIVLWSQCSRGRPVPLGFKVYTLSQMLNGMGVKKHKLTPGHAAIVKGRSNKSLNITKPTSKESECCTIEIETKIKQLFTEGLKPTIEERFSDEIERKLNELRCDDGQGSKTNCGSNESIKCESSKAASFRPVSLKKITGKDENAIATKVSKKSLASAAGIAKHAALWKSKLQQRASNVAIWESKARLRTNVQTEVLKAIDNKVGQRYSEATFKFAIAMLLPILFLILWEFAIPIDHKGWTWFHNTFGPAMIQVLNPVQLVMQEVAIVGCPYLSNSTKEFISVNVVCNLTRK